MAGVSKEQIAKAKEWDLLSYLQYFEPQELKKGRGGEYCTASHDSLKISNGKWNWHSKGIGGRTALDYLIKVREMGFVEAVEKLCGEPGAVLSASERKEIIQEHPKPFSLPEANRYGTAAVIYLQKRGIDADIISECIRQGNFYEGRKYQNCVFVGRDSGGAARYAFMRGIYGDFKMDVEGSDKRFGFCLSGAGEMKGNGPSERAEDSTGKQTVFVAESPVDALSVATLLKLQGKDWIQNHYLSLGGTAPLSLLHFLKEHPQVTKINLCLDNDKAGIAGMEKIREAVSADKELSGRITEIRDCPPPAACGKDYNLLLVGKVKKIQAAKGMEKKTVHGNRGWSL